MHCMRVSFPIVEKLERNGVFSCCSLCCNVLESSAGGDQSLESGHSVCDWQGDNTS